MWRCTMNCGRSKTAIAKTQTVLAGQPREVAQAWAGQILERPASAAEEHFALFYRGLPPEDLAQVLHKDRHL